MRASVQWKENMTFVGLPPSGFPIQMDADTSIGGNNQGVRPMELIMLALAGCTGMDVLSILRKKRQQVTQFEVMVDAPRSADFPQVFTHAQITYVVSGVRIEETAIVRSIELSVTKYCPVQFMLARAFPMELRYEIYEDLGGGNRTLAFQGLWEPDVA
jgi:putative redox protein